MLLCCRRIWPVGILCLLKEPSRERHVLESWSSVVPACFRFGVGCVPPALLSAFTTASRWRSGVAVELVYC